MCFPLQYPQVKFVVGDGLVGPVSQWSGQSVTNNLQLRGQNNKGYESYDSPAYTYFAGFNSAVSEHFDNGVGSKLNKAMNVARV